MNHPRPIDSAPRDGTAILTDDGVMCYIDPQKWGSPEREGWVHCDCGGGPFEDDFGKLYGNPFWWTPLPDWVNR